MISTPCSTFFATSSMESAFPMPIRGRQKPASVCTDSGWVIRNTAWRTSLAVNSPQFSWNFTPLRSQTVQLFPSGAISHFSASSGMYAPVLRSIPMRYSSAGRLSSWPLRLCSQVKLVSQPRGATAILSRSSFGLVGAGCAQATATANPMHAMLPSTTRLPHLCIVLSSALRSQLDVLQVREVAGNGTWKRILRDILGVHGCVCVQPEQRDLSKFINLMIADLAQQPSPFRLVHHRSEGCQALFDHR